MYEHTDPLKMEDEMQNETTYSTPNITPLHVERGRQMRQIVQHDMVQRGWTFEQSVENLSGFLGVEQETVKLGIGIVNSYDDGTLIVG